MTAPSAVQQRLDDPLADCRERGGGIGIVGPDVPVEVLLASQRPFGHLPWRVTDESGVADRWLESSFPFWARSIVEQWHAGRFDDLDRVVFSRADDASQRLYYYITELRQRGKLAGPRPAIFDIALIPRMSSEQHTVAAIVELMQMLDVSAGELSSGIQRCNELRQQLAGIEAARVNDGPAFERLARAALWTDPSRWIGDVQIAASGASRQRLLLAGSMPPDERIHEAVESAGASIVAEAQAHASGRLGTAVNLREESPELSVARNLRRVSVASRSFVDRAAWLVERARAVRADAVVIWLTREDEALAWSVPAQQRALSAAGMPCLVLAAASWRGDDGALDRIARFCREGIDATA